MIISKIDFGPIDARNDFTANTGDSPLTRVFVNPFGIDLDDYVSGRKCFIFGIKGTGKSTLLRIIKERVEKISQVEFLYFSDAIKSTEQEATPDNVDAIPASELSEVALGQPFWRSFFILVIARHIAKNTSGTSTKKFLSYVYTQATGETGTFRSIVLSVPYLKSWAVGIGAGQSRIELDGEFKRLGDIGLFYNSALALLRDVNLRKPFYIFLDELEISFSTAEKFEDDVEAAASLIMEVRNLNESFRQNKIPVFIVCAVRKEVSQKILGQDAAKIVRDLGYELSWQRPTWSSKSADYYHPLFEIVLRRIHSSENKGGEHATWSSLKDIEKKYFNFRGEGWTQKTILDLTTYRPRDIPALFSRVKEYDGPKERFDKITFERSIRKGYRDDLWRDFAEALRTEYSKDEVNLLKKVFFSLPSYFRMADFMRKADDFSGDPEVADLLDQIAPQKWSNCLKDLYELGAVGWSENNGDEEKIHFHFRGDTDGLQISRSNFIVKPLGLRDK
ncbi:P-loop ATPase, Sll1717 family [Rhodobacter capsulatus]|uniref:P-loop ATPase, Sll1717 family n=1 Tax=Rhodobacter capsulatus TaxID=1061 RepID=UPI0003D37475|nr:hypothetical protein [Rhodobacter capsulatus]ETD87505.1 hypothetical protein U716_00420 [Rhodobacter capsulatus B6]